MGTRFVTGPKVCPPVIDGLLAVQPPAVGIDLSRYGRVDVGVENLSPGVVEFTTCECDRVEHAEYIHRTGAVGAHVDQRAFRKGEMAGRITRLPAAGN